MRRDTQKERDHRDPVHEGGSERSQPLPVAGGGRHRDIEDDHPAPRPKPLHEVDVLHDGEVTIAPDALELGAADEEGLISVRETQEASSEIRPQ